jgi:hypothetical protein
VDLGEVSTSKIGVARAGRPAPSELGRTLDGKPVLTADYHGRFVVCAVLDSLSRSAPALPRLAEVADKFSGDKRVALVAINADPCISGILRRPATLVRGWKEAYFSCEDGATFAALSGSNNWPPLLIVGPDGLVAASGLTIDQFAAKLTDVLEVQSH